jgi:hypothetical protein
VSPLRLAKAFALSFALGAILSFGSSPVLVEKAEAIAWGKVVEVWKIVWREL